MVRRDRIGLERISIALNRACRERGRPARSSFTVRFSLLERKVGAAGRPRSQPVQ